MKNINPSFATFVLFYTICLLVSCKQNFTDNRFDKETTGLKDFYGQWTYNFPFYSSELKLSENGIFTFHDQGCTGHNYTEGRWTRIGSNLILTSYDKYKNKPEYISEVAVDVSTTSEVSEKVAETKTKKRKIKLTYTLTIDSSFISSRSSEIRPNDTTYMYFPHVVFKINGSDSYGSILCELDSNLISTNRVFIKSGKLPNQVDLKNKSIF